MKKILLAWIEQVLLFDNEQEKNCYIAEQTRKPYPFKVLSDRTDADGKVILNVRKGYNNNQFPE